MATLPAVTVPVKIDPQWPIYQTPDVVLPRKIRQAVYMVTALVSLIVGALHVAYGSVQHDDPEWLIIATAVWGFIVSAPIILALINVPSPTVTAAQDPAPVENPAPSDGTPDTEPAGDTQPAETPANA